MAISSKINYLQKLPAMFLGVILGITFGSIAGGLFVNMGLVPTISWEPIFIFLSAVFGGLLGYSYEE